MTGPLGWLLAAALLAPGDDGRLVVSQEIVGRARYIEGSVSYVQVRGADGRVAAEGVLPTPNRGVLLRGSFESGQYTVASWHRACTGTCQNLDPPSDRCWRTVRIREGRTTRVTVRLRPGRGCRIVS